MGKAPSPSRVTVRPNWLTKRVSNIGSILLGVYINLSQEVGEENGVGGGGSWAVCQRLGLAVSLSKEYRSRLKLCSPVNQNGQDIHIMKHERKTTIADLV